ncbi:DNA mismatch repair protein Mlh1 [Malassezia cuniculi]|uniref:DNA mismatch repair protein Mlh1 n=1 Tax=Malassezia cuniculi TaxID=948313 RepID=A0AAF0F171_9BASI|nr:DNA mismatch repair protein Mlh1 [Malassezia cuniculi]
METRPIQLLSEDVVNRIAAGEVVQDGGIKLLQIQDNGCGIPYEDLPLVCQRFATSKLRTYDDLEAMSTFGFRGEALASISFVSASLSVVSKTARQRCAYRCVYADRAMYANGVLVPPKPGQSADPQPTAGTNGTTITAVDLFYNAPQRRRALRSATDEYSRILDVASKYAVHYGGRGIGMSCKKVGSNALDLNMPSNPSTTTVDAIRTVYGGALVRDLVHVPPTSSTALGFECEGWISTANYVAKKTAFLCFINNRLVDVPSLKRSLESMYAQVLPKGRSPWIYMRLDIEPHRVDVNVHPTKKEVHFTDEDEIVELITSHAQCVLSQHASVRVVSLASSPNHTQVLPLPPSRYDPRHLVRVDHNAQTLEAVVPARRKRDDDDQVRRESQCSLTSVQNLRERIEQERHPALTDIMQNHTFVGIVDLQELSLIQHNTRLYLVNHAVAIEEFAYQLAVRQFGDMPRVMLDPPPSIPELIGIGYDLEDADEEKERLGLSRDEVVSRIAAVLSAHSDMLDDYFAMRISDGRLEMMPALLPNYESFGLPIERLPTLLFRLGPQVDWDDEERCFEGICREIAYAHVPTAGSAAGGATANAAESACAASDPAWLIQHVWFAHMSGSRARFLPPRRIQGDVIQVANLPDLYRVFERC